MSDSEHFFDAEFAKPVEAAPPSDCPYSLGKLPVSEPEGWPMEVCDVIVRTSKTGNKYLAIIFNPTGQIPGWGAGLKAQDHHMVLDNNKQWLPEKTSEGKDRYYRLAALVDACKLEKIKSTRELLGKRVRLVVKPNSNNSQWNQITDYLPHDAVMLDKAKVFDPPKGEIPF